MAVDFPLWSGPVKKMCITQHLLFIGAKQNAAS